jgi:hypothetical protein
MHSGDALLQHDDLLIRRIVQEKIDYISGFQKITGPELFRVMFELPIVRVPATRPRVPV